MATKNVFPIEVHVPTWIKKVLKPINDQEKPTYSLCSFVGEAVVNADLAAETLFDTEPEKIPGETISIYVARAVYLKYKYGQIPKSCLRAGSFLEKEVMFSVCMFVFGAMKSGKSRAEAIRLFYDTYDIEDYELPEETLVKRIQRHTENFRFN